MFGKLLTLITISSVLILFASNLEKALAEDVPPGILRKSIAIPPASTTTNNNTSIAVKTATTHSLSIFYMVPKDEDEIYNLNEKHTFDSGYTNGWILASGHTLLLNLYLFYDGNNQQNLNKISNMTDEETESEHLTSAIQMPTLYMYFTTEEDNCDDYHKEQHLPLKLVETLSENMFKMQISARLNYADKPYYMCMQQIDSDDDLSDHKRFFAHQGTDYWLSIVTTKDFMPLWTRIMVFSCLLLLSGLFSGLNLGLMSLDLSELEILKKIGTTKEKSYAEKIYPLRKRGNFLLCTILLGNVLVNSTSTLILGDLLSGIYAAFGSTILIVLFGEIIPQAACSKHGLAVGANTRHIMYFFMILTSPVSFPLSKMLDFVLGKEIAATYNREKLRELMRNVKDLDKKELKMIDGALDFNKRIVKDIMTPLKDVYMLELSATLDFQTIAEVSQKGYSRIPIYEKKRENVVGLLHVKDFTLLDPDDNMSVARILDFYERQPIFCEVDCKLDEMFEKFRQGQTHLAFVRQYIVDADIDPYPECVGIITLEDIIEELVQLEIYDEFDDKKDIEREMQENENEALCKYSSDQSSTSTMSRKSERSKSPSRKEKQRASKQNSSEHITTKLRIEDETVRNSNMAPVSVTRGPPLETQNSYDVSMFIQQQREGSTSPFITPQVRLASFQFLCSVEPFSSAFLTQHVLQLIYKRGIFKESRRTEKMPPEYLYQYGKTCNYFILILSGEATIEVGKEKLEFVAGSFAYFGVNALLGDCKTMDHVLTHLESRTRSKYIPDFSLRVDERCAYLKIDRSLWLSAVRRSKFEITHNKMSASTDLVNDMKTEIEFTRDRSASEIKSDQSNSIRSCVDLNAITEERRISNDTLKLFNRTSHSYSNLTNLNHENERLLAKEDPVSDKKQAKDDKKKRSLEFIEYIELNQFDDNNNNNASGNL